MVSRYKGIIQGGGRSAGGKEDGRVVGRWAQKARERRRLVRARDGRNKRHDVEKGGNAWWVTKRLVDKKKAGLDPLLGEKYLIPSLPWSLVINQAKIRVACLYFKRA